MTLRAIAFHEAISVAKLAHLFEADVNQLFGGTLAAKCPNCGLGFAVFFPAYDDPENGNHVAKLQRLIADDCKDGKHLAEYEFRSIP